jgi:hypothetical protein
MKRKWKVIAPLLLVCMLVSAWFEPTGVVRGWVCGQAFYQGRPTNYWSRELARWQYSDCWVVNCTFAPQQFHVNTLVVGPDFADQSIDAVNFIEPAQENTWIVGRRNDMAFDLVTLNSVTPNNVTTSNTVAYFSTASYPSLGTYQRSPGLMDKLATLLRFKLEPEEPPGLLNGDPEAEAVLRELLDDRNPTVREHAERALKQIPDGERP